MKKLTISPDSFAMVCFLVLMQNGGGIIDKHPSYISEKTWLLKAGIEAFGALDIYNKRIVIAWCNEWNVEPPKEVLGNLKAEEEAFSKLKDQGINL